MYFYIMIRTEDLFRLLEDRRQQLGLSQSEVGRRSLGQSDGSAIQNIRRGSSPTFENLQRICDVLGLRVNIEPIISQLEAPSPVDTAARESDDAFSPIPILDVALAAGNGHLNEHETVISHLAFRVDWLRGLGLSASNAVVARALGESMAPTIYDGDMVLIDRARAAPPMHSRAAKDTRPAPIYAILDGNGARIKRLAMSSPGVLALLSDNPEFPPDFQPVDQVHVIGRVMWWGHTNREV